MNYTLIITAQYFENKAFSEGGFAWSPKGEHEFQAKIDVDTFTYMDEEMKDAFVDSLLESQGDDVFKYSRIGYRIKFFTTTKLGNVNERLEEFMDDNFRN